MNLNIIRCQYVSDIKFLERKALVRFNELAGIAASADILLKNPHHNS